MTDASLPSPRRSISTQAILLVVATVIAQGLMALIYIVGARSVPPSEFGRVVAAIAVGTASVGYLDFGSNSLWVRELARGSLTPRQVSRRASSKVLVGLVVAVAWSTIAASVWPTSGLWVAGPVGFSLLLAQTIQVPLRASARMELVAATVVLDRVMAGVFVGLAFVIGVTVADVMWVALTIGALTGACVSWFLADKSARLRPSKRPANPWANSQFYGISSLASTSQSLDVTLLAAGGGTSAAGLYGSVSRWAQPLSLMANAFASVSVPYVSRAASLGEAWRQARRAVWLIALALLGAIALFALADPLVRILLGPDYLGAVPVLRLLALAAIPGVLNQPVASFLQSSGYDRRVSGIVASGVALQLLLVVLLAPIWGAVAAATALLVGQSAMLTALATALWLARRSGRAGT